MIQGSLSHANADPAYYYKAPYLLHLAGRAAAAHRVLDYIAATFLQPNGDVLSPDGSKTSDPVLAQYPGYINGWITIAATKLGRFDVAVPTWAYLRRFRHPELGGFMLQGPYEPGGSQTVEMFMTAHLGLTALYRGELESAITAGEALERFLARQPDPERRMYLRMSGAGELITDYPAEAAGLHVVEAGQASQAWFFIGYPIAFESQLHLATREERFLNTARDYAGFALQCRPHVAREHFGHKVGWGAAQLARVTGDADLRALAVDIADHLAAAQSSDGTWLDDEKPHTRTDQSVEVAIWLLEITALLGL
jgi:hypothetical protein